MTPISTQPKKAPEIVPFPPSKVTPPMMAAVRALVSYPAHALAVMESMRAENMIAATEQNSPAIP